MNLDEKGLAGGQPRQGLMSCKALPKEIMPASHFLYYTGEAQSSLETWECEVPGGQGPVYLAPGSIPTSATPAPKHLRVHAHSFYRFFE